MNKNGLEGPGGNFIETKQKTSSSCVTAYRFPLSALSIVLLLLSLLTMLLVSHLNSWFFNSSHMLLLAHSPSPLINLRCSPESELSYRYECNMRLFFFITADWAWRKSGAISHQWDLLEGSGRGGGERKGERQRQRACVGQHLSSMQWGRRG